MSDNWIPIIIVPCIFACIAYVAFLLVDGFKYRQRAVQAREFQQKLLDRVTSAQDLSLVLSSEGTARLLTSLGREGASGTHGRILRAIQAGVVLLCLGVALFLYVRFTPQLLEDTQEGMTLVATIALALGVGCVGAAGAAYFMSSRMGILDARGDGRPHASELR